MKKSPVNCILHSFSYIGGIFLVMAVFLFCRKAKPTKVQLHEIMSATKVKRVVGKYELGRTIGEGTFAKVKFARNSQTGDPVAIKILDKEKVLRHKMAEQVLVCLLIFSFQFFPIS